MSAFDSLIRGSASFRELGSMISQSERSSVSQVARFLATFEKFKPGYYAAQDLYKMISTQRLYIHPTFGNHVYLSGGPSIERQDPIFTHYSAESASTPDFLMTCAIRAGVSLNLTMAKYSMTSVYGADTLKILEGIGYATPLFPVFPKFQIDFSFGTYTYNPAESRSVENLLF